MIYVGIDVAKSKHDCCILESDGLTVRDTFTFANDRDGFNRLMETITATAQETETGSIKAGLEATGHYSENLVSFLRRSGVEPVVFNPLQVNRFRKSQTLRKTKTDKVDAKSIAQLLMTSESSPAPLSYQIKELKTLTRHRTRLVAQRARLKVSIVRLVDILFPNCHLPAAPLHRRP